MVDYLRVSAAILSLAAFPVDSRVCGDFKLTRTTSDVSVFMANLEIS